jgi:beta-glucosidase/6-phospho-beta-glucosidase/beta-galactosidase
LIVVLTFNSTDSSEDAIAVQRAWDFNEGWFANPTFLGGDYPKYLKDYVSGFLPAFTEEQKTMLNGSSDFFAHDAYTSEFYMGTSGFAESDKISSSSIQYH